MGDDSFDLSEFENYASQSTTTAWQSRVQPKKGRRTYSRRGSTGAIPRTSQTSPTTFRTMLDCSESSSNSFLLEGDEPERWAEDRLFPDIKRERPPIPGPTRFTRAHTISEVPDANTPTRPPAMRRSQSVSSNGRLHSFASMRSSSASSSLDSFPPLIENIDPNYDPLEENASPKRGARATNMRGRKKSRSSRNLGCIEKSPLETVILSSSFSNLAREDVGLSWGKPPPPSDQSPFHPRSTHSNDFDLSDFPEYSPATSICSRKKRGICDSPFETFDDDSLGGLPQPHYSSARARSRFHSPPTRGMSEFSLETSERSERVVDFSTMASAKNDRDMDAPSEDGDSHADESGDDGSVESGGNRRSPKPTFLSHEERQRRRSSIPLVNNSLFFASNSLLKPETSSVDDVIRSMPSYEDLHFLAMSLDRQKGVQSRFSWTVVPRKNWPTDRRTEFLNWSINSLGFTIRCGGGDLREYIQIPKSKGARLLSFLEAAVAACKERGIGKKTPANREKNNFTFCSVQGLHTPHATSKVMLGPQELTSKSLHLVMDTSSTTNEVEESLLQGMLSLGMEDKSPPEQQVQQQELPLKSSIIFEDVDDVSYYDSSRFSMDSHQNQRLSVENHQSSRDLMAHMQPHGLTPVPRKGRPPRLSLQSVGSVATTGTSGRFDAASPYVLSSAMTSYGKADSMLTPMMQAPDQGWGCCPVDGRDWGVSEAVGLAVITELTRRLDQSRRDAGFDDSKCEDKGGPQPTALGLELDAVCDYLEKAGGSESTSLKSDTGPVQDILMESSPSSSRSINERLDAMNNEMFLEGDQTQSRAHRRRQTAFAKHQRMSLYATAVDPAASILNIRKSLFIRQPRSSVVPSKPLRLGSFGSEPSFPPTSSEPIPQGNPIEMVCQDDELLQLIFGCMQESELLKCISLVNTKWADVATQAHARMMLLSVGCLETEDEEFDDEIGHDATSNDSDMPGLLERPWRYLTSNFPWACFLSEGTYKKVYKVFNHKHRVEEAISVMDVGLIESTGNKRVVGAELAVSVLLSSLVRRGICPNFVATRGVFSCRFKPPPGIWGSATNKAPKGFAYMSPAEKRLPKEPKQKGRYQYIRMELCDGGDVEEYLKDQPDEVLQPDQNKQILFQITFALHAAADRFSMKHYDLKLLNVFLQRIATDKPGDVVLRYGLGHHLFTLRCPKEQAILAKLADYGTANVDSSTNGKPVTISQFTTLENTPPDFMILGDEACQGHGHDAFGLGLCMLHLFTGSRPYEEVLEDVVCTDNLKESLREIWESEDEPNYSVIRSLILADVYKDEEGHIVEGEPDEVLYDTFYRYLVLFGIPHLPPKMANSKVWVAVRETLDERCTPKTRRRPNSQKSKKKKRNDINQFNRDRRKFSLSHGTNLYIKRARKTLESMEGGMALLFGLTSFDPQQRTNAIDVLNSPFMATLREERTSQIQNEDDEIFTFSAFSVQN